MPTKTKSAQTLELTLKSRKPYHEMDYKSELINTILTEAGIKDLEQEMIKRWLCDVTYKEIAKEFGTSITSTRDFIMDILTKLRKHYKQPLDQGKLSNELYVPKKKYTYFADGITVGEWCSVRLLHTGTDAFDVRKNYYDKKLPVYREVPLEPIVDENPFFNFYEEIYK